MTTAHNTHKAATPVSDAVVLRPANSSDYETLRRLADLDSSAPITSNHVLVAEHEGEIVAALDAHTGRSIADPFQPTAGLVDLLQARATLLRRAALGRRRSALTLLQRARSAA